MSSQEIQQTQNTEVAGFIAKTFQILNNNQFSKIIYWAPSGSQFIIKDVTKFQQAVLPRYFRHSKMNSFIRQLNMYGFHKSRNDHAKSVFSHPLFLQGREDLLITIKRKIKGKNNEEQVKVQDLKSTQTPIKKPQISQETTTKKDLAETGRQLRSTRQFSFLQENKINTFNLLGSKDRLPSRMNFNMSLRKLSSRELPNRIKIDEDIECVSIEDKIEKNERQGRDLNSFKLINPSCFFASMHR